MTLANDINKDKDETDYKEEQLIVNKESEKEEIKELNEIQEISPSNKKSMCDKYFSKLEPGSLRSSIFSLSILTVGIGCLALPERNGQISVLLMIIMLIIATLVSYFTLDIVINAARHKGLGVYSHVIEEFCGRGWAILFDASNCLFIIGIIITYQIISKHKLYILSIYYMH